MLQKDFSLWGVYCHKSGYLSSSAAPMKICFGLAVDYRIFTQRIVLWDGLSSCLFFQLKVILLFCG